MILPDLSVLIHAHNLDSPLHSRAIEWWDQALSGDELVVLPWAVILGFVRLTTNRSVFASPLEVDDAVTRVEEWLARPNVRVLNPSERHFSILSNQLRAVGAAGNLTTDAHLASLAIEHDCTVYTTDADFARFPGLRWKHPLR